MPRTIGALSTGGAQAEPSRRAARAASHQRTVARGAQGELRVGAREPRRPQMTLEFPSGEKVVAPLGARELREGIAHRANIGGKRLVPEQIVDVHERDETAGLEVPCEARQQPRAASEKKHALR
ncbi:MAG: hypothetical protein DIU78_016680 [Pseudomonadota bacterium]|nr:MAG: hypothetical protein DIU78_13245 [Pseudomonadota bacterium]